MNISIAMAALTLSACDRPYGSNCPLGDPDMPCAHLCGKPDGHEGGCGGCDCGS